MRGLKVFLRDEDISEQVESLSAGSVSDYKGGVYAVTEIKYVNGCIEVYDFDDVVVTKCDKKPFDISEHEFLESDIQGAEIVGKMLRLHLMSGDLPYIEKSKADVIAEAKALGVTAKDLK